MATYQDVSDYAVLLKASSYKQMEWKNGKGKTSEIAIFPAGASMDSFLWRLSSAPIVESCDFSLFTMHNRILTLIEGKELLLEHDSKISLPFGEVFSFSGEKKISAALTTGPVVDLGLIYHKEKVQAQMKIIKFNKNPRSFAFKEKTILFFVISGSVSISTYPKEINFQLEKNDCLELHELKVNGQLQERIVLIEPKTANACIAGIEIKILS